MLKIWLVTVLVVLSKARYFPEIVNQKVIIRHHPPNFRNNGIPSFKKRAGRLHYKSKGVHRSPEYSRQTHGFGYRFG